MQRYNIGGYIYDHDTHGWPGVLVDAYAAKIRPFCMCTNNGVEMYLCKLQGQYYVKRMPNTGSLHSPDCESYEPPPELSGLGQVMGQAIQENPDDGTTALKFEFSLSKIAGRPAPTGTGTEKDSVKSDGNKLTLRGTLHYLWEQAGFNRWTPGMGGKRTYAVIRKYLLIAAEGKLAKGSKLADMLYIPEPYNESVAHDIEHRRIKLLQKISAPEKGARKLMLVVGVFKSLMPARYGSKLILGELPDYPFMVSEDLNKKIEKRFSLELQVCDASDSAKIVVIATFGVSPAGVATIEDLSMILVNEHWLPFENSFEQKLLSELVSKQRRFTKSLRYNMPSNKPLASVVANDTETPCAMYVVPPSASEEYVALLNELTAESNLSSWIWNVGEQSFPLLPLSINKNLYQNQ